MPTKEGSMLAKYAEKYAEKYAIKVNTFRSTIYHAGPPLAPLHLVTNVQQVKHICKLNPTMVIQHYLSRHS